MSVIFADVFMGVVVGQEITFSDAIWNCKRERALRTWEDLWEESVVYTESLVKKCIDFQFSNMWQSYYNLSQSLAPGTFHH